MQGSSITSWLTVTLYHLKTFEFKEGQTKKILPKMNELIEKDSNRRPSAQLAIE